MAETQYNRALSIVRRQEGLTFAAHIMEELEEGEREVPSPPSPIDFSYGKVLHTHSHTCVDKFIFQILPSSHSVF